MKKTQINLLAIVVFLPLAANAAETSPFSGDSFPFGAAQFDSRPFHTSIGTYDPEDHSLPRVYHNFSLQKPYPLATRLSSSPEDAAAEVLSKFGAFIGVSDSAFLRSNGEVAYEPRYNEYSIQYSQVITNGVANCPNADARIIGADTDIHLAAGASSYELSGVDSVFAEPAQISLNSPYFQMTPELVEALARDAFAVKYGSDIEASIVEYPTCVVETNMFTRDLPGDAYNGEYYRRWHMVIGRSDSVVQYKAVMDDQSQQVLGLYPLVQHNVPNYTAAFNGGTMQLEIDRPLDHWPRYWVIDGTPDLFWNLYDWHSSSEDCSWQEAKRDPEIFIDNCCSVDDCCRDAVLLALHQQTILSYFRDVYGHNSIYDYSNIHTVLAGFACHSGEVGPYWSAQFSGIWTIGYIDWLGGLIPIPTYIMSAVTEYKTGKVDLNIVGHEVTHSVVAEVIERFLSYWDELDDRTKESDEISEGLANAAALAIEAWVKDPSGGTDPDWHGANEAIEYLGHNYSLPRKVRNEHRNGDLFPHLIYLLRNTQQTRYWSWAHIRYLLHDIQTTKTRTTRFKNWKRFAEYSIDRCIYYATRGLPRESNENPSLAFSPEHCLQLSDAWAIGVGIQVKSDYDNDKIIDWIDNCPTKPIKKIEVNGRIYPYIPNYADINTNNVGDECDEDIDGDQYPDKRLIAMRETGLDCNPFNSLLSEDHDRDNSCDDDLFIANYVSENECIQQCDEMASRKQQRCKNDCESYCWLALTGPVDDVQQCIDDYESVCKGNCEQYVEERKKKPCLQQCKTVKLAADHPYAPNELRDNCVAQMTIDLIEAGSNDDPCWSERNAMTSAGGGVGACEKKDKDDLAADEHCKSYRDCISWFSANQSQTDANNNGIGDKCDTVPGAAITSVEQLHEYDSGNATIYSSAVAMTLGLKRALPINTSYNDYKERMKAPKEYETHIGVCMCYGYDEPTRCSSVGQACERTGRSDFKVHGRERTFNALRSPKSMEQDHGISRTLACEGHQNINNYPVMQKEMTDRCKGANLPYNQDPYDQVAWETKGFTAETYWYWENGDIKLFDGTQIPINPYYYKENGMLNPDGGLPEYRIAWYEKKEYYNWDDTDFMAKHATEGLPNIAYFPPTEVNEDPNLLRRSLALYPSGALIENDSSFPWTDVQEVSQIIPPLLCKACEGKLLGGYNLDPSNPYHERTIAIGKGGEYLNLLTLSLANDRITGKIPVISDGKPRGVFLASTRAGVSAARFEELTGEQTAYDREIVLVILKKAGEAVFEGWAGILADSGVKWVYMGSVYQEIPMGLGAEIQGYMNFDPVSKSIYTFGNVITENKSIFAMANFNIETGERDGKSVKINMRVEKPAYTFDYQKRKLLIYGGIYDGSPKPYIVSVDLDTYTYLHVNQVGGSGPSRTDAAVAYDSATGQYVTFGGTDENGVTCHEIQVYNPSLDQWYELADPYLSTTPTMTASLDWNQVDGPHSNGAQVLINKHNGRVQVFEAGPIWDGTPRIWTWLGATAGWQPHVLTVPLNQALCQNGTVDLYPPGQEPPNCASIDTYTKVTSKAALEAWKANPTTSLQFHDDIDFGGESVTIATKCNVKAEQHVKLTGLKDLTVMANRIDNHADIEALGNVALYAGEELKLRQSSKITGPAKIVTLEAPIVDDHADYHVTQLYCAEAGDYTLRQSSRILDGAGFTVLGDEVTVSGDIIGPAGVGLTSRGDLNFKTPSKIKNAGNVFMKAGNTLEFQGDVLWSGKVELEGSLMTVKTASKIANAAEVYIRAQNDLLWQGDLIDSGEVGISAGSLDFRTPAKISNDGNVDVRVTGRLDCHGDIVNSGNVSIATGSYKLYPPHKLTGNESCVIKGEKLPGSKEAKGCTEEQ